MKTNMETFRKRFKALRVEKGLTQEKLAEKTGYSVDTIQRLESGLVNKKSRCFSLGELVEWAEFFGVSVSYLCGQTDCKVGYRSESMKLCDCLMRIKILREDNGMTSAELSKELGFKPWVIDRIEKQQRGITINELITVADYFHVNISYLCGETDSRGLDSDIEQSTISQIMGILKNYDKDTQRNILEELKKQLN